MTPPDIQLEVLLPAGSRERILSLKCAAFDAMFFIGSGTMLPLFARWQWFLGGNRVSAVEMFRAFEDFGFWPGDKPRWPLAGGRN